MNEIINGLWIGGSLGVLGRLSITSFLRHGHPYHLYCYDDIVDVPAGTIVKDANEILPASEIFYYQRGEGRGSVAAFADLFRYKLLLERGGWWMDTDVVCLKALNFPQPIVFANASHPNVFTIAPGMIKLPAGHPVADQCYIRARQANKQTVRYAEIGPELFTQVIRENQLEGFVLDAEVFSPIPYWDWQLLIAANPSPALQLVTNKTVAIHLWHEMFRRAKINKRETFPETSLLARLMREYGIEPSPIRSVIETRLDQLKREYEKGQKMMADWESKMANLEKTMLRISGAIQVLEEIGGG